MKKIAIFASGSGTNFEAIVQAATQGQIKGEVVLLVCDNPTAYVIERAKNNHIDNFVFTPKSYHSKSEYEQQIEIELKRFQVDLVVLAGYMRLIGDTLLSSYGGKIINIHPALLPSFPGKDGILQAYNYGVKIMGITIHYVDSGMDTGKIIAQSAFDRQGNESLDEVEAKIHALEHRLYPQVINQILTETI